MSVGMVAAGNLVASAFQKVGGAITGSLDKGIKRIDTIKNANVVFEAMGYAADDVSKSMDSLTEYLDGLPTAMDAAVQGVQILSASFGGIDKGTKAFKAMNDAGLAFGATSAQVENAIFQLSQTSLDGPLDAATWNSLRNSGFSPVFAAMAEEAGITVGELKEQFGGNGTKTVGDFLDALEKLDNEGGGHMESLASLARKNTNGIGTAIENVQNRLAKAWEVVLDAIGRETIANAINKVSSSFSKFAKVLAGVVNWAKQNKNWLMPMVEGALAFVAALGAIKAALSVFNAVKIGLALLTSPIGLVAAAIAAIAVLVISNWDKIKPIFDAVYNWFSTEILPVIQSVWAWIQANIVPMLKTIISLVWSIISTVISVVQSLMPVIQPVLDTIISNVKMAFNIIGTVIRALWPIVKAIFDSISSTIKTAVYLWQTYIAPIYNFFFSTFSKAYTTVSNKVGQMVDKIKGIPDKISAKVEEVKTKIKDAIDGAKDAVKSAVDSIVEFITGIPDRLGDVGGKIGEKITGSVSGAIEGVKSSIGGILSGIPGLATGGYVKATPGGTLAVIGEGGEDEFVVPRSQMIDLLTGVSTAALDNELPADEVRMGGNIINYNNFVINNEMDADDIGRRINNSIRRATI